MSETPRMTEPPKKRRFWQLHLSTAVGTMLIVGASMLLNLNGRISTYRMMDAPSKRVILEDGPKHGAKNRIQMKYGWPSECCIVETVTRGHYSERREYWTQPAAVCNVGCCILWIVTAVIIPEYLIRRREGRKP
jgi:hypothetical protein